MGREAVVFKDSLQNRGRELFSICLGAGKVQALNAALGLGINFYQQ